MDPPRTHPPLRSPHQLSHEREPAEPRSVRPRSGARSRSLQRVPCTELAPLPPRVLAVALCAAGHRTLLGAALADADRLDAVLADRLDADRVTVGGDLIAA